MRHFFVGLVLSLCSWALSAATPLPPVVATPTPRAQPLPVEVAVGLRSLISTLAISPDGKLMAFTVKDGKRIGPYAEERMAATGLTLQGLGGEIWLLDLTSGTQRRLTADHPAAWAPVWSPDGRTLAFFSAADDVIGLWLWDRDSGNLRRATNAIVNIPQSETDQPIWVANGQKIFANFLPPGITAGMLRETAAADSVTLRDPNTVTVSVASSRSPPYPANARTPRRGDFGLVDVVSGTLRRFALRADVLNCTPSPTGQWLACNVLLHPGQTTREPPRFAVFSSDGEEKISLPTTLNRGATFSWSANGRYLIVATDKGSAPRRFDTRDWQAQHFAVQWRQEVSIANGRWDTRGNFYVVGDDFLWRLSVATPQAVSKRALRPNTASRMLTDQNNLVWRPAAADRLVLRTRNPDTFYTLDFSSGTTRSVFVRPDHQMLLTSVGLSGSSTFLYSAYGAGNANDFWRVDAAHADSTPRRVTLIDPDYEAHPLGEFRPIELRDESGERLIGSLLLPPGYRADRRYPLVVWAYGGERQVGLRGLLASSEFDFQLLASRGYVVLQPAAPIGIGTAAKDLVAAILPAIEQMIARGIADGRRVALMGNSFGGYTIKVLLVQAPPDLIKAAITSAGLGGNLFSLYADLHVHDMDALYQLEGGQLQMPGNAWEFSEKYFENSPFFQYPEIHTPLQIQVGLNDSEQIRRANDETFVALRRLGVEVEYLRYAGEGHGMYGYANQVDYWNRRLAFLAKHLNLTLDEYGAIVFEDNSAKPRVLH